MATPLVSVLMPAYNHAAYIRIAIVSVLHQTHANLELIIVDDASSDATWDVISGYDDSRIKASRHDLNQGAHATLNQAMQMAQGDYLAIINSDDVFHPERIERLVAEAKGRDVLMFTDVAFIDSAGERADNHSRALDYEALHSRCANLPPDIRLLTGNLAISTSNFFCSRNLAEKIGPFAPLRYTHDWDWALRASQHSAPIWMRDVLLSYRVHDANTLSEDDAWRHIHENSYVQAKALLGLSSHRHESHGSSEAAHLACRALLENESLHPLALNVFLVYMLAGVSHDAMLDVVCARDSEWLLSRLANEVSCSAELFRSLGALAANLRVIEDQKTLIEARWQAIQSMSAEIDKRDVCIASQVTLIDQKDRGIEAQGILIKDRDRYIDELLALLKQRDHSIEDMSCTIAMRDADIAQRDADITQRDADIAQRDAVIVQRDAELVEIRSMLVVRVVLRVRRWLSRMR